MCSFPVYSKNEYIVVKNKNGYIVINTKKTFDNGHTHFKNLEASKKLIHLAIHKKIPKTNSDYFLESLIRISNDEKYINKIKELIEVRKNKGNKLKYVVKR